MSQQSIDWNKASFESACRSWGLNGVEMQLMLLALTEHAVSECVEEEVCSVVESSQRRVGRIFGCSDVAVKKALLRLGSKGLASHEGEGDGTVIVLCVSRLFNAPPKPPPKKRPALPTGCKPGANQVQTGCKPGANQVQTTSSVPLEEINHSLRSSVSVSVPLEACGVPDRQNPLNFLRRTELLPWDRERFTDADLQTLDRRMLRVLFAESVRTKRLAKDDTKPFLAAAWHCANHPGLEGKRAKVFAGRINKGNFRGLSDAAWDWAREMLESTVMAGGASDYQSQVEALEAMRK